MTRTRLQTVLIFVVTLSAVRADDITLTDGTVLKNAKIVQRDESTKTVTISFSGGITQVHSEMLPPTPSIATPPTKPNPESSTAPSSGPTAASSPTPPSLQKNASDFNAQGFDKFTKGDFDGAISDFNEAIALDPKLAEAYNRRGNAERSKGNSDSAIADYKQAIAIDPTYANPHNNLGTFKVENGDFDGAIRDFDEAIALDPKLPQAYLNRGIAKRDKGYLKDAISDFNQAIALDSKLAPIQPSGYSAMQEAQSFAALVQKDDPTIGDTVGGLNLKLDTLEVTVTDSFIRSPYESRLEFAEAIYKLWSSFHNAKAQTYVSPVSLIDSAGTVVGGVDGPGVWVKRTAVFVAGTVFQKVEGGVILSGISAGLPYPWQDVPKGMKAVAQFDRVFIKGYGGEGVDGALVEVTAYREGTFTYTTVLGASSTIVAYTQVSQ